MSLSVSLCRPLLPTKGISAIPMTALRFGGQSVAATYLKNIQTLKGKDRENARDLETILTGLQEFELSKEMLHSHLGMGFRETYYAKLKTEHPFWAYDATPTNANALLKVIQQYTSLAKKLKSIRPVSKLLTEYLQPRVTLWKKQLVPYLQSLQKYQAEFSAQCVQIKQSIPQWAEQVRQGKNIAVILDIDGTVLSENEGQFYKPSTLLNATTSGDYQTLYTQSYKRLLEYNWYPVPEMREIVQELQANRIPYLFLTARRANDAEQTQKNLDHYRLIGETCKGLVFCKDKQEFQKTLATCHYTLPLNREHGPLHVTGNPMDLFQPQASTTSTAPFEIVAAIGNGRNDVTQDPKRNFALPNEAPYSL